MLCQNRDIEQSFAEGEVFKWILAAARALVVAVVFCHTARNSCGFLQKPTSCNTASLASDSFRFLSPYVSVCTVLSAQPPFSRLKRVMVPPHSKRKQPAALVHPICHSCTPCTNANRTNFFFQGTRAANLFFCLHACWQSIGLEPGSQMGTQ